MLRALTLLSFALAVPVAAQVAVVPPRATVAPLSTTILGWPDVIWRGQADLAHTLEQAQDLAWSAQDLAWNSQDFTFAYNYGLDAFNHLTTTWNDGALFGSVNGPRAAWAKNDPADSLYRSARDLLNRGDYRKSASQFKELPQKFPTSVYVNDAMYWQAFALYRIGSTPELQEALTVLEVLKARAPAQDAASKNNNPAYSEDVQTALDRAKQRAASAAANADRAKEFAATAAADKSRLTPTLNSLHTDLFESANLSRYTLASSFEPYRFQNGGTDATQLAARIARVLSERGLAGDAAVKRALANAVNSCDSEDQQVRAEALQALMQSDPEVARQSAIRALAKKDECSASLRRSAVVLLASTKDEATANLLIPVAKSDPSTDVRTTAIDQLSRMPGKTAVTTLQDLAASGDNEQIQISAVRALSASSAPEAKAGLRALIEKNDAMEFLRTQALKRFGQESSPDDISWLRGVYPKVTSPRVKEGIVSAVARIGGDANDQWLSGLVRNEDEPLEARMSALRAAGRSMGIIALGKLYDASTQRQIRSTLIDLLSSRKEPAAVDKLIDIAKTGTDPGIRRSAISALARSKDPRAQKMLLDLVDHE